MDYTSLDSLSDVLLEESFVLAVDKNADSLVFRLDAVLTPTHPLYTAPLSDETFCHRLAFLVFRNPVEVSWLRGSRPPSTDAAGEIDFGNIDVMTLDEGRAQLEGDWGEVEVEYSEMPFLVIEGQ